MWTHLILLLPMLLTFGWLPRFVDYRAHKVLWLHTGTCFHTVFFNTPLFSFSFISWSHFTHNHLAQSLAFFASNLSWLIPPPSPSMNADGVVASSSVPLALPLPADIARHPDKQGTSEIPEPWFAYSSDKINEQFGEGSNAYFRIFSEGFWNGKNIWEWRKTLVF